LEDNLANAIFEKCKIEQFSLKNLSLTHKILFI